MARPFDNTPPRLTRLGPPPDQARRELLLLHGAWAGAWMWEPLDRELAAAGYGVNLLDLPGHGEQRWDLPATTSLKDYAACAARAAAALGRPVLIGHSMGGWIVQKLLEVADLPALLLAPLPGHGLAFSRMAALNALDPWGMAAPLMGRPLRLRTAKVYHRLCFSRLPLALAEETFPRLCPEPARVALEMALGLARAKPAPGRQPRLLIAGSADFLMPPTAMRALAARLGAEFLLLEGFPHNLWLEDPEGRVGEIVRVFLERLPLA